MMTPWLRELCRLLSSLLEYPTEEPCPALCAIRAAQAAKATQEAARTAPDSACETACPQEGKALVKVRAALAQLAPALERTPLSVLQAMHVQLFDLTPECSLHLTWHRYGDSPRQGRALAGLSELYKDYGFELIEGHLPDYLPLLLEFMAEAPDAAAAVVIDGFGPQLRELAARISASDSVYAPAGQCLTALTDCLAPEDAHALRHTPDTHAEHSMEIPPCMAG